MFFRPGQGRLLLPFGLVSLFVCGGCSRQPEPAIQRLAILRFENMTPDPATDWMGRAFAEVVTTELASAKSIYAIPASRLHRLNPVMGIRPVSAPGISAEAALAGAAGANRIAYGEYSIVNGRLRSRLTIEDLQGRRLAQAPIESAAAASDVIGAATALSRQISPDSEPYGTQNAAALEAYARAMESPDPAVIGRYAEQAIAADPNFGIPYIILAETKLNQQDRAGATSVLKSAAERGTAISQGDRVRLEVLAATLQGDRAGLDRALAAQVQLNPVDPAAWRALAEAAAQRHQFPQAVQAYQRTLAIEPDDINTLNQLGYTAAFGGNVDVAMSALRRYQALRPLDPNALDSMGDVNVITGHLQEAERLYLESYQKAPAFQNGSDLQKAAIARLMTGDVAGANAIMKGTGGADWLWITGQRKEAYSRLAGEAAGMSNRDLQGRAYSDLAVWSMLLGNRDDAAAMAAKATALATPANGVAVALARFISLPPASPAEWSTRAQQLFPNAPPNSIKDVALASALLLNRHFEAAAVILKQLEDHTPTTPDRTTAIQLAWALVETGNFKDAAPLLRLNPIRSTTGASPLFPVIFPRLYQLRAIVATKEGRADEARENRRIFTALGGS